MFGEQGGRVYTLSIECCIQYQQRPLLQQRNGIKQPTSGGEVDITVDGHTDITGAVIASIDENGNDTGNLSLTTGSLDFTDLTDTHYSTDSSVSLNTNVLLGDNTTAPPKGVTTQPQDSKGDDQRSGTTNLGLHDSSSYGEGKTLATVGEGTITVGGEEAEPEGLNRDTDSTDKELYSVDRTKADLDVTVDNQTLAEAADGVQETAGDVAHNLGLNDVTQFLYDIDDANISAALKDNAEETLDLLIASDVAPAVAKALLTNPEFYNTVASILTNGDALGEGSAPTSEALGNAEQSPHVMGQPLNITMTEGLSTTPVQNVLLGLKDVKGFVSGLPAEEAQAAMIGLGLLTGGVVKTAVDVAKDVVVDTALGAQIRDLQQNVAKVVAAGATGVDVGTHERLIEVENGSGFSTDLQFGLEVIGLGTGIGVAKKADGNGSSKNEGVDELEVNSYRELKSREIVGDGLEHDHIPSFAALKAAEETKLGRKLTPNEERALYNNSTAVEVPRDVHQAGRTYGGKNTKEQISQDAQDLCGAVCRDTDALKENLLNKGYNPDLVNETIKTIIKRNESLGE